jgi:hypothetical protein
MELIVNSGVELQKLRRRQTRRGISRLVLAFPHNDRDSRIINRTLRVCGCDVGAIFLAAALLAIGVGCMLGWRSRWWVMTLIVFGATLIGKITGILIAEWRFRAALDRLGE